MPSLDRFLSFSSAAQHGSFARAARELGLSPSAIAKNVARLELHPDTRVRIDDGEALVRAAATGMGLVQAPDYMVEEDIKRGRVIEVLKPFRPAPMPISIVYPSQRHVPPRVKALIDELTQRRSR